MKPQSTIERWFMRLLCRFGLHRWISVAFSYDSWFECADCGKRFASYIADQVNHRPQQRDDLVKAASLLVAAIELLDGIAAAPRGDKS